MLKRDRHSLNPNPEGVARPNPAQRGHGVRGGRNILFCASGFCDSHTAEQPWHVMRLHAGSTLLANSFSKSRSAAHNAWLTVPAQRRSKPTNTHTHTRAHAHTHTHTCFTARMHRVAARTSKNNMSASKMPYSYLLC